MKRLNHLPKLVTLVVTAAVLCAAPSNGAAQPAAALKKIASGFVSPTDLVPLPGETERLLILDQVGTVHILTEDGEPQDGLFLDLRNRLANLNKGFDERGLLGLAFHPDFRENRRLFVYYSAPLRPQAPGDWNHTSHISEFKVYPDDPLKVDPSSERILLRVDQPQFNHDAGSITFGPDGYLYIPLGDGGKANDSGKGHPEIGNGQDITTLLGSILRIDVDSQRPYAVPDDNPFVGRRGRDEIYAYGLRNPWGIAFDPKNPKRLFAADVGQNMFEEVNLIRKGGNYGWNIREGLHCFDPDNPNDPPSDCPDTGAEGEPLVDPILEYPNRKNHSDNPKAYGVSVVGGYVYRGDALPSLQGDYIFADWSQDWGLSKGTLLRASPPSSATAKQWAVDTVGLQSHPDGVLDAYIVALGQDTHGEIYVMTSDRNGLTGNTGKVWKLVPEK